MRKRAKLSLTWLKMAKNLSLPAVAVVVAGAYGIGTIQERIFTCGDFTISGNSQPPGCTPGEPSLELGRR